MLPINSLAIGPPSEGQSIQNGTRPPHRRSSVSGMQVCPTRLNGDELLLNGVFDELDAIVHVDFFHEIVLMRVHGLHAEIQS